jgi:ketosteroid isomerase-like protein
MGDGSASAPARTRSDTAVVPDSNVEVVRRAYGAFAQRTDDRVREDSVVSHWHKDARWYPLMLGGGALEGAVYEGHEGIRRFTREQADEAWSEVNIELLEVRALGDELVLAHPRLTTVGESSGVRVQAETWAVFTLRDHKIIEGRVFADEASALAYGAERSRRR